MINEKKYDFPWILSLLIMPNKKVKLLNFIWNQLGLAFVPEKCTDMKQKSDFQILWHIKIAWKT